MKDIVYFDLETQRSFSDVGGSAHKEKMGVSVGVTYSTKLGEYRVFGEDEMENLVNQLMAADLVVGFNHIDFDYAVLQKYTILQLEEATANLDLLVDVEQILGHRVKLDSIAGSSLGMSKTGDGLDALKWWQEHKKTQTVEPLMKIAKYCCFDVKVTKAVHEYGIEHGHIKYPDKVTGEIKQIEVNW